MKQGARRASHKASLTVFCLSTTLLISIVARDVMAEPDASATAQDAAPTSDPLLSYPPSAYGTLDTSRYLRRAPRAQQPEEIASPQSQAGATPPELVPLEMGPAVTDDRVALQFARDRMKRRWLEHNQKMEAAGIKPGDAPIRAPSYIHPPARVLPPSYADAAPRVLPYATTAHPQIATSPAYAIDARYAPAAGGTNESAVIIPAQQDAEMVSMSPGATPVAPLPAGAVPLELPTLTPVEGNEAKQVPAPPEETPAALTPVAPAAETPAPVSVEASPPAQAAQTAPAPVPSTVGESLPAMPEAAAAPGPVPPQAEAQPAPVPLPPTAEAQAAPVPLPAVSAPETQAAASTPPASAEIPPLPAEMQDQPAPAAAEEKKAEASLVIPAPLPVADSSPTTTLPDGTTDLSQQTRNIVTALPKIKKQESANAKEPHKIEIDRSTAGDDLFTDGAITLQDKAGIEIAVKKPDLNANYELERAYNALLAGNQEGAIIIYRNVLEYQPENAMALFGLATTYHRLGRTEQARPLYGRLLTLEPQNAEALNNFLALMGEESPQNALQPLESLEAKNPDFSPIPAQIAIIQAKLGNRQEAARKMLQALQLSPENMSYRYNLAVILDQNGDFERAAEYYKELLDAAARGANIPAKRDNIQERLTFLRSNKLR